MNPVQEGRHARAWLGTWLAGEPLGIGMGVISTQFQATGQAWWTLALEATGPASLRRTELEATAALVFAQALPGGMELGTDHSQSYAQWLISCGAPGNAHT